MRESATNRIPELDGIRGLAILCVVIWHYFVCQIVAIPGTPLAYAMKSLSLMWAGVDLFFVLSGFLIARVLLAVQDTPNYFWAFYVRRIFRIFPLYYLMLCIFTIVTATISNSPEGSAMAWLFSEPLPTWSYVAYLQNFSMAVEGRHGANFLGITWSLAVEEQFYLILPAMIRFVRLKTLAYFIPVLIVSAPIARVILLFSYEHGGIAGYVLLPCRWDALFLGVLGTYLLNNSAAKAWLERRLWIPCFVLAVGMGVCMCLIMLKQGIGSILMASFGHTIIGVMGLSAILLGVLGHETHVYRRLLRNGVLVWLGTVSYGIYLLHQPMMGLCYSLFRNRAPRLENGLDLLTTFAALFATALVAWASWTWFESKLVRFGQRTRYSDVPVAVECVGPVA